LPFEKPHVDWETLLNEFSGAGIWTREVTLKQRSLSISELTQYLVSERAKSQPVGLGPQVLDAGTFQIPIAPTIKSQSDATRTSDRSKPDVITEPVSQPATIQSNASLKPVVDTLDLYLRYALPPMPNFIPAEYRAIIAAAVSQPRTVIHGGVGSGKTHVLYTIAHELKQAGQVPLYLHVSGESDTPLTWTSFCLQLRKVSSGKRSTMRSWAGNLPKRSPKRSDPLGWWCSPINVMTSLKTNGRT
jgi:hypothetical protein